MRLPRSVWRVAARVLVLAGLSAPLAACDFLTGVPSVSRVDITVTPTTIAPNQVAIASGVAFGRGGRPITTGNRQVVFSSSDPTVATVNATNGQVIGLKPGTTIITGESDGKRDTVTLTVRLTPVRQVILTPKQPTYRRGVTTVMTAIAVDSVNATIPNRPIAWRSSDTTVATVSAAGLVTPRAVGTTTVFASVDAGAVFDSTTVRVTEIPVTGIRLTPPGPSVIYVGDTLPFTAALNDSTGATVSGRPLTWLSRNPTELRVTDAGLAIALAPTGAAFVEVRADVIPGFASQLSTSSQLQILGRAVRTEVLGRGAPPTLALTSGAVATVTVVVRDQSDGVLGGRTLRVTSNNPTVATGEQSGRITAGTVAATSTAVITFQALDINGNPQGTPATITVTVSPVL